MSSMMWEFDDKPKLIYPGDHKMGMKVTKGGSSCKTCRYVTNNNTECVEKNFVAWYGSGKFPQPADEWCCDFWNWKDK